MVSRVEKITKLFLGLFIVCAIWGATFTGLYFQGGAEPTEETQWEKIKDRGSIYAVTSPDYPPYEYKEGGELKGFDIELMEKIGEELDLEVKWTIMDYPSILPAIKEKKGNADLAIAAYDATPGRIGTSVQATMGYWTRGIQLVLTESAAEECNKSLDSLGSVKDYDFSIGVQSGSTQHEALLDAGLKDYIQTYDKADAIIAALNSTSPPIDGTLMDQAVSKYIIKSSKKASWGGSRIYGVWSRPTWKVSIYLHDDFDELCTHLNQAIIKLHHTGWIQDLAEEYKL